MMSPEMEAEFGKLFTECQLSTWQRRLIGQFIADAFRQVWREAIEAAKAVCEREGYEPDRTITDPQFAWLSACVVCGLEIDDLKEVD